MATTTRNASRSIRNPKVAILGTRGYPSFYGGFETAVRQLAPYFRDNGWQVVVYSRDRLPSRDKESASGVKVIWTTGIETKQLSTLSHGLTSFLHAVFIEKPNVALVMNVANGFWLPFFKLAKIKTIVNVDGIEWERDKWGNTAKKVFKAGAWFCSKFADELVSDSKVIQRHWRENFKVKSSFIPYGGIEPQGVINKREPTFGQSDYVLVVARLVPENSIDAFIDAIPRMDSGRKVVIVGSAGYPSPLEVKLKATCDNYENVCWLGHVSDDDLLFELWENCGVYFHGHTVGGTNPALVSAMTAGSTILAADTGYNREVLGETGFFCEPTPDLIAVSINKIFESKMKRPNEAAIERAKNNYSWAGVSGSYLALLNDLNTSQNE